MKAPVHIYMKNICVKKIKVPDMSEGKVTQIRISTHSTDFILEGTFGSPVTWTKTSVRETYHRWR